ncbi:MAG: hypothetical protein JWM85_2842, partial [Acidimicrobiaceae bacterium]|nr:hypothetical protein [Acidimicrobiaceae bacterium]
MPTELQLLIDHLAHQLGSSMVLEDREHRTIVHSSQAEPIDAVRRDSILNRATRPEIVAWFRGFGIEQATEPVRIPAHEELGILPRVCAPARCRDQLLGYLWLIDSADTVSGDHLDDVAKAAEHFGLLLYDDQLTQRLVSHTVAHLFSPSGELRETAARQIVDQSLLARDLPVTVVVLDAHAGIDGGRGEPGDLREVLKEAVDEIGWQAPARSLLGLAQADHGVLVLQPPAVGGEAFVERVAEES